jgi:hypothetical protein
MSKLIEDDPLRDADLILTEEFYGRSPRERGARGGAGAGAAVDKKPKPTHYKIVCISLYTEDIERLEALVAELKRRGHTKANKSAVIRYALDSVDIGKMPKGY